MQYIRHMKSNGATINEITLDPKEYTKIKFLSSS